MSNLKSRLLLIAAMIIASVWALFPRTVVERVQRDGVFVHDTIRRVPLKRGLDLQGGMHLTLEVDESKQAVTNVSDALDRALTVVRTRIDEFGVAEPIVQKVGETRITVELPGIDDRERATAVVQRSAVLRFQITDETQALERAIPRLDGIVKERGLLARAANANADTAPSALGSLFQNPTDSAAGDSAGTSPDGPFRRLIQQGNMPGQYMVAARDVPEIERYLADSAVRTALPPGKEVRWGADSVMLGAQVFKPLYVLDVRPIIDGTFLLDAKPAQDPLEGAKVDFQFNNAGGQRFRTETARHIGDNMAIVLDDRVMTAPVIQSAIGARGQITMGGNDLQAATDLALVLRAGALPVPLKVVEARTIGASLGEDAIRQGLSAGALGIGLVILIMIVYYRFSGFLAVCGLAFYVLVTLAILAGFGATLTLPGLAGFVLSIGMAVDANFLIFERIREELEVGKTTRLAIDQGFNHAWSAIVDTHVTTALTAAILYQFGTGPVRGFAVALLAGLAASLVSAIFVVRTLFILWLSRAKPSQTLSI
ncbi:MAG TPA: protein translocase subunit SecD [Gemmatimonadaceae bacterium]|jgi:preprotein translocase subunit SecD|nr:protein translocase subunit SecD [Gemmatimonadaceae bacterium]